MKHQILSLRRSTWVQEEEWTLHVPMNPRISLGFAGELVPELPCCHLLPSRKGSGLEWLVHASHGDKETTEVIHWALDTSFLHHVSLDKTPLKRHLFHTYPVKHSKNRNPKPPQTSWWLISHLPGTRTEIAVPLLLKSTKAKSWTPPFPAQHSYHPWYLCRQHNCCCAWVCPFPDTEKRGFTCESPNIGGFTPQVTLRLLLLSASFVPSCVCLSL